tara:strand:+ start:289 stop:594 length:306 start_codon:yes stop_codon:yes gene_type:complete
MAVNHYMSSSMHLAILEDDAVFRDSEGNPVIMSFHPYLGPIFEDKDGVALDHVSDLLWEQFDGWWNAKGKDLYPKTPMEEGTQVVDIETGEVSVVGEGRGV